MDNRKLILFVNGKQREREREMCIIRIMNEGLIGYIFEINVVYWLIQIELCVYIKFKNIFINLLYNIVCIFFFDR